MRLHSIRVKITAITIAAIITTILSIFAASSFTIQVDTDRRSVEMMNLIARDTGNLLEQYFTSIEQAVEMVANIAGDTLDGVKLVESGIVENYNGGAERTEEQVTRLDEYLAEYCIGVRQAFESVASHTNGVVSYYYCILPEISKVQHGFFYSKVGKTGFYAQKPLDVTSLDPEDLDHNAWFLTPIQRGRPSWVGPYSDVYADEMQMYSYIVPIYKAGVLVGVLGMDIPFDVLIEQVSPIHVYKTGFACLLDADDRILYHPELPVGSTLKTSGLSIDGEVMAKSDNGDNLIRYSVLGIERQMSFTRLSNDMRLVITAPVNEINASRTRLIRIVLLVMIAIIIFFAALLLPVMGLITRPLQRLTAASKRLANADYDVELKYASKDEVGELTAAFIKMRDQQKRYIEDLNHRVYTDALTELPNMRHFFKLAEAERTRLLSDGRQPVM
ncbi:MAG: HAMP domain-containing protein, partial [Clostridia bacterium]|nr:HAMP domain-containing protein [Clostridia bacterium]